MESIHSYRSILFREIALIPRGDRLDVLAHRVRRSGDEKTARNPKENGEQEREFASERSDETGDDEWS